MRKIYGIWNCVRPFMTSSVHRNAFDVPTKNLVTVETFKTVKIISLNRPDKQNALNEELLRELASHLSEFEEDPSASVVVINGNGGNFSIGYDIDELKQKCEQDADAVRGSIFFPFQRKSSKPFLCSISGQCKGIGLEIALMCDVRYVEEKSCLAFNNQKLGIPLLNGGPKRLANLIGLPKAIDFLLTDRQINAEETVDLGIANGMVQDGTGLGSAMKTAVFLSSLPQAALRYDMGSLLQLSSDKFNDTETWTSIVNDIKSNVNLSEESRKTARVSKLNNMPEWELEEIQHEENYAKAKQKHIDKKP